MKNLFIILEFSFFFSFFIHIIFINFTWAICAFVSEQFKNEANFPFYSNSIINLVCHLSYVFLPAIYFTHHINMLPYKYIYFQVMYAGQISVFLVYHVGFLFWCVCVLSNLKSLYQINSSNGLTTLKWIANEWVRIALMFPYISQSKYIYWLRDFNGRILCYSNIIDALTFQFH